MAVYVSVLLSQIIHLLPRLCPQVCLFQHLHCCPVDRFISSIFLDSIYVLIYSIFHYFFRFFPHFRSLQSILLLGGSVGKESACSAGDLGSIPGSGRSPGGGSGNPVQYSCLGNPMDRGAWWATSHGVARVRHDLATNIYIYIYTFIYSDVYVSPNLLICYLFFKIKFYWHTATLTDYMSPMAACKLPELNWAIARGGHMACRAENNHYAVLYRKSLLTSALQTNKTIIRTKGVLSSTLVFNIIYLIICLNNLIFNDSSS